MSKDKNVHMKGKYFLKGSTRTFVYETEYDAELEWLTSYCTISDGSAEVYLEPKEAKDLRKKLDLYLAHHKVAKDAKEKGDS